MSTTAVKYSFFVLFAMTLVACKKDNSTTINTGKSYFPLKQGAYVIYDVDSSYYDDFYVPVKVNNTKFQLKEKVESFFYDNENRLTARIERYVKHYDSLVPYSAMQWALKDVWVSNLTNSTAERVEENVRFVKLVFPMDLNKSWDANIKNVMDEREYTYTSINTSEVIGGLSLDSIVTTEYDDGGAILTSREYSKEKYSSSIGLIYREEINVSSQPDPNATSTQLQLFYATPIMQRITSGYSYTWTINSYGTE